MSKLRSFIQFVLSTSIILSIGLSAAQPYPVAAQGGDGIKRQLNAESGKVSFIGPESGRSVPASKALETLIRPQDPAMALAKRFGPEFGLINPEQNLSVKKSDQLERGRLKVRYQQNFQGIPVMGGELIVNTNTNGDLYSINGEVSPDLTLSTEPTIDSEQAKQFALQAAAKWYQKTTKDFLVSEPELWIFDESLLLASTRPAELVWRMEVTSVDNNLPVRELVLINAQRGNISLHFNQIDNAWTGPVSEIRKRENATYFTNQALQVGNWPVYFEIILDESRGWIYGSDSDGSKVDVISMNTLQLVKSFALVNGASPKGLALSANGNELAVAQFGASSILFLNPDNGQTIATLTPDVHPSYPNKPWDVIYGRSGRLYSSGNPNSSGIDYIHVINTNTHTEISKSSFIIRATPYLAISADKNTLYVNETFSPNKLYNLDVTTDTIPEPISTAHTSGFSASTFILDEADNLVFTDAAQIWSSDLKAKIGSTGHMGQVTYIPTRNAVAVAASDSNSIVFVSTDDFYVLSTYALQGSMGPLVAQSNGNKLFVSTNNGVVSINLTSFPPGTPVNLPSGALPYFDLILDEGHNVLYGSNTTGHKIDIISTSTLQVIDEIRFNNGASPMGMDLSANGSELAVALNGASALAFINTNTLTISATVIPNSDNYNVPFDVKYGRVGRLYSSGNPDGSGIDYLHVFDTTTHTEVGISTYPNTLRSSPYLAVSADKNYLLANEQFSPNKLYRFNITTDTISSPTSTDHSSGFRADTFLLLKNETKIFTSTGQVWSNPSNLATSSQIGSFSAQGYLAEIQSQNLVAVLGNPGSIKFVKTTDYSILSTLIIPAVDSLGPSPVNTNESKLFVNSNHGVKVVNLDPALPSQISIISGSNQTTFPQSQFSLPFKVKLQNFLNQPLSGRIVTFTAPQSGASGTFSSTGTNVSTASTDANGIATSSTFSANAMLGNYSVKASATGLTSSVDFLLSNSTQRIKTYTANNSTSLPGIFLCDQMTPNCTNGMSLHADKAHQYAIGIDNLYFNQHSRHSIDNNGMTIISSVSYCSPSSCPYYNAFWDGTQMVFGSGYGFALADDVVAHEYTHGVTQYESNLFYYYQSGAINESFSDLWGEYYDQSNGLGNDTASVKWLQGEDISGLGANRSMIHPPAYGDPDKMSSTNYYEGEDDSGGVHTNSGVNNKAVYLMVDGGTFNGKTVTTLGWTKAAAIYYEAQIDLLTSGSDYSDLYYALQQACSNLIGQNGITASDCIEVKDAIDAVEMNSQPAPNFNADAPLCDAGTLPTYTFTDDIEAGTSNWTFSNGAYARWQLDSAFYGPYAQSGVHSLYADDYPDVITDASARLAAFTVPVNGYLHFAQAYDFEDYLPSGPYYFDGGVLEYSTNGGSTWLDAGSLIDSNGYRGVVFTGAGNPLSGRWAFVGTSHGYISTRLNLSGLVGKSVTFRWRMGLDEGTYSGGWWVDNIKVYSCIHPNSNLDLTVGTTLTGKYYVPAGSSIRQGLPGIDNGPVKIVSTNSADILAAMRVIWREPGVRFSYSEMLGLPKEQLSTEYWFPWYNNSVPSSMDQGFRIANVDATGTNTIQVSVGSTVIDSINLGIGASVRVSYPVDNGPIRIACTTCTGSEKIIAALRIIWKEPGYRSSYSEMMGLPKEQLSSEYWFPWYNNAVPASMDQGFRIANVDTTASNTVEVWVGATQLDTIVLGAGASTRVGYSVDNGPIRVTCSTCTNLGNDKIIAALRVIWKEPGFRASYSEMMGLPTEQLSSQYWFPWYNNAVPASMDQGFRIANISAAEENTVEVWVGSTKLATLTLGAGGSTRVGYNVDNGPIRIICTSCTTLGSDKILAALRVIWKEPGFRSSYSEMMGLPHEALSTEYWFPWYNFAAPNSMDQGFRIAVP